MHVMHETVEYMHRLLCIVHTTCINTSIVQIHKLIIYMHVHSYVMHLLHFTMLFSTGYTAVYTYTQTHLHDLLVANYTGNGQSTV